MGQRMEWKAKNLQISALGLPLTYVLSPEVVEAQSFTYTGSHKEGRDGARSPSPSSSASQGLPLQKPQKDWLRGRIDCPLVPLLQNARKDRGCSIQNGTPAHATTLHC